MLLLRLSFPWPQLRFTLEVNVASCESNRYADELEGFLRSSDIADGGGTSVATVPWLLFPDFAGLPPDQPVLWHRVCRNGSTLSMRLTSDREENENDTE